MRSIAAWLLLASFHQEPVPSQVTAAGSCAHVTRPGTIPRGTPNGESGGSNSEDRKALVAAIERAKSRRVISMAVDFSVYESSVQTAPVKGSRRAVGPKFVVLSHKVGTDGCRQGATNFHPYASVSKKEMPASVYPEGKAGFECAFQRCRYNTRWSRFLNSAWRLFLVNRGTTYSESVHHSKRFKLIQVVFVKAKRIRA